MRSLHVLAAIAACVMAQAAFAGDPAIEAPIHRMMDGFNAGDIAAAKAAHVASPTIVDNFAPFRWSGPTAFDSWVADLGKAEAAQGKSDGAVVFGDPVDEVVDGDRAYVVTPSSYTYKQNGQTLRAAGMVAFVLIKLGDEWKVESWSWASPAGKPVD